MNRIREQFLLHRIRSLQDAQAYAELYDAYLQRIYRFIYFKVGSKQDAEELTAEVFLGAWTYLCQEAVSNINALLYKMARNKLADFYRTKKEDVDLIAAVNIDDGTDTEADADVSAAHREVVAALKRLHSEYAQIVSMRYLDQLEIAEIAQALGKTRNNIRVTLHRAMAALKTQMTIQEHAKSTSQPIDRDQG
ncbi:hypothetical protein COV06_02245 [Candidatus Uhrbacteria bacterium CG10_big_fil_rev_8_21_14_0_10_50_16]|uniref:RNA polymerase sigma factor 70 region 4 type 2 domain-containing protein n=1 Tax=Candidatus Uhrbacteria bacterium CG10_big_fil_rev_8_21_14_0_10_50_16 TaxID=1975039 RepID=A0A2H0RMA7_9BACT|nr:MAG: hypothetical protein COV06_02245 [Candidatus Uhrbacteria bacterium CG10_big_fil_rev_8_21_14_0_10_50_16]